MTFDLTIAFVLIIIGSHVAIYEVVDFVRSLVTSLNLQQYALAVRIVGVLMMAAGFWMMYPAGLAG